MGPYELELLRFDFMLSAMHCAWTLPLILCKSL